MEEVQTTHFSMIARLSFKPRILIYMLLGTGKHAAAGHHEYQIGRGGAMDEAKLEHVLIKVRKGIVSDQPPLTEGHRCEP